MTIKTLRMFWTLSSLASWRSVISSPRKMIVCTCSLKNKLWNSKLSTMKKPVSGYRGYSKLWRSRSLLWPSIRLTMEYYLRISPKRLPLRLKRPTRQVTQTINRKSNTKSIILLIRWETHQRRLKLSCQMLIKRGWLLPISSLQSKFLKKMYNNL